MLIFEAKPFTMIRKIPRLPLARTDQKPSSVDSRGLTNVCLFRALNLSVLGVDTDIRIHLNLSNVPSGPDRQNADPAFGTKIDVYYPTSFVQFSQGNPVNTLGRIRMSVAFLSFLSLSLSL